MSIRALPLYENTKALISITLSKRDTGVHNMAYGEGVGIQGRLRFSQLLRDLTQLCALNGLNVKTVNNTRSILLTDFVIFKFAVV